MGALHRLTAKGVEAASKPGRYADGGNLFLSVSANGGRRWVFLFRWQGRRIEMGLGSARTVSLAEARKRAAAARAQLEARADPRLNGVTPAAPDEAPLPVVTFGACADDLVAAMAPSWRNEKHVAQWRMTLDVYAAPIREKPVEAISTADVLSVLQPIWYAKPETASRLRGRIERVLDAAKARGLRSGENPARWRGHIDQLLPAAEKLRRGHHAALPFADLPTFFKSLAERDAPSAQALQFLILTAARSGEVRLATCGEIDLTRSIWTVPASRMKSSREHRVPLAPAALALVEARVQAAPPEAILFPRTPKGERLSETAFQALLERMDRADITAHGFRSTFKDWASECTSYPNEVSEMALAHVIGDKTEAAYRRGDLFEKRRALMADWAIYCASRPST
ncbi:MAG: tyrosine-type recombinase/integrase [Caulobacterales bacterium]